MQNYYRSNESNIIEDDFPGYFGKRKNIEFSLNSGLRIKMRPPENIKVSDLLTKFMKKLKVSEQLIDDKIFFLFNGYRIRKNDERNTIELGMSDGASIIVIDSNAILGG